MSLYRTSGIGRPTKGPLQGHSIGGEVPIDVYGDSSDEYIEQKGNTIEAIYCLGQPVQMPVTTCVGDVEDGDRRHSTRGT